MPKSQLGSTPSRIDAFAAQYTMRCPSVPRLLPHGHGLFQRVPADARGVIKLAGLVLIHAIVDVATFVFHVCTNAFAASVAHEVRGVEVDVRASVVVFLSARRNPLTNVGVMYARLK